MNAWGPILGRDATRARRTARQARGWPAYGKLI